jgi:hypothetical protein
MLLGVSLLLRKFLMSPRVDFALLMQILISVSLLSSVVVFKAVGELYKWVVW